VNRTREEYEKIGRAVVARLEQAIAGGYDPLTVDSPDFVRRDSGGRTSVHIAIDRYCPGCGLPARLEVQDGTLLVKSEPDPLRVGDSILGRT
jgi:hypothetical protein